MDSDTMDEAAAAAHASQDFDVSDAHGITGQKMHMAEAAALRMHDSSSRLAEQMAALRSELGSMGSLQWTKNGYSSSSSNAGRPRVHVVGKMSERTVDIVDAGHSPAQQEHSPSRRSFLLRDVDKKRQDHECSRLEAEMEDSRKVYQLGVERCDEWATEIRVLRSEIDSATGQESEARNRERHSEESLAQLKSRVLRNLDDFDEAVMSLGGACGELGKRAAHQRQHLRAQKLWDWAGINRDLHCQLTQSEEGFERLSRLLDELATGLRRRADLTQELNEQADCTPILEQAANDSRAHRLKVEEGQEKCTQEFMRRLRCEEVAHDQAKMRFNAERDRSESVLSASQLRVEQVESEFRELELESVQVAGQLASVQQEAVEAAKRALPREVLLEQLEHRDAATWRLNDQIVAEWREEKSAEQLEDHEQQAVALLRNEFSSQLKIVDELRSEELTWNSRALEVTRQLASDEEAAQVASAEAIAHEEEVKSQAQASYKESLTAMREALHLENEEWRVEMAEVRSKARALHGEGLSGLDRALQAWDAALEAPPENSAPAEALQGRMNSRSAPPPPPAASNDAPFIWGSPMSAARTSRSWGTASSAAGIDPAAHSRPRDTGPKLQLPERVVVDTFGPATFSPGAIPPAQLLGAGRRHQVAVDRALDTLDALMQGGTTMRQADAEWASLAEAEGRRIAALAAQRAGLGVGVAGAVRNYAHP